MLGSDQQVWFFDFLKLASHPNRAGDSHAICRRTAIKLNLS